MKLVRLALCTLGAVVIATSGLAGQQQPPGDPPQPPPAQPTPVPKPPARPAPPAAPAPPAEPEAKDPVVKLLEKGEAPHKELRLQLKEGQTLNVELTMDMSVRMKFGEMETPPQNIPQMRFVMETSIKDVSPEGDAAYEFKYIDASIVQDPGMDPRVAQMVESMIGLHGTAMTTNRGFVRSIDVEIPEGADPVVRQQIQSIKDSLRQVATPVPQEPVGVGGKWQVEAEFMQRGVRIKQVTTHTVMAINRDDITISSEVSQSAELPQTVTMSPTVPPMELQSMQGKGQGKSKLRLTQLVPAESESTLITDTVLQIKGGEPPQQFSQHAETTMKVKMLEGAAAKPKPEE